MPPINVGTFIGVIAEEMYNYLERDKFLPEEQKGCKRGSRGTKDELFIDKTVLKDFKKRHQSIHGMDRLQKSM